MTSFAFTNEAGVGRPSIVIAFLLALGLGAVSSTTTEFQHVALLCLACRAAGYSKMSIGSCLVKLGYAFLERKLSGNGLAQSVRLR